MTRRQWLSSAAWAIAVALAAALLWWAFAPRPIEVQAIAVRTAVFERVLEAEGRTRVRDRYVVSAPVAGRLLRSSLKAGDLVARGDLLAVIVANPPTLLDTRTVRELDERVGAAEAEVARTRASGERADAALRLAASELARQRELGAKGFASRQALDRAEREVDIKEREVAAARQEQHGATHQLALAKAALLRVRQEPSPAGARWDVRAPVSGRVLRIVQESETAIPAGGPLMELGNAEDLEVVADVLTVDAIAIPAGAAVEFQRGDSAAPIAGRVRLVEPGAFTKLSALGIEEQRVNVVMDFADAAAVPAALGDGYRLDARILVERHADALVVPVTALFRQGARWLTFVLEDRRARLRKVEVASRSTTLAMIAGGLAPGERVIVYPSDVLRDGARVRERAME